MYTSNVTALNRTVQQSMSWLEELADIGGFYDERQAYSVLRAVLHTLRDQLTVDEAAHLGAQMPMLIRGMYYEGWSPSRMPCRCRSLDGFLRRVDSRLRNAEVPPEPAVRAVFELLDSRITAGEIADVVNMMPAEIRELWCGAKGDVYDPFNDEIEYAAMDQSTRRPAPGRWQRL